MTVADRICELFGETVRNMFGGCGCYYFLMEEFVLLKQILQQKNI